MKNRHLIYILAVVAISFSSCKPEVSDLDPGTEQERNQFVSNSEYGIFNKGGVVLTFDANAHQLYSGNNGKETRIVSSNGEQYLQISVDQVPGVGKSSSGHMTITDGFAGSLSSVQDVKFFVLKKTTDHIWFWCDEHKFGAVMLLRE